MTEFHPLKIVDLRPMTPSTIHVRVEGGPLALYEAHRLPGMSIRLRAGGALGEVGLASQPARRYFEALVELETELGAALAKLSPGADVEVSQPRGAGFPAFEYRRHDLFLIGHGAGLGPVRAAALYALTERGAFDGVRLLAEAHFVDEIPYHDEFPSWQRGGVRIYQVIARPDVGKWRRSEQAYAYDLLGDLRPDAARSVVFACGPADMLQGVQGVLRKIEFPPEKLYIFELDTTVRERAKEAERLPSLLDKITIEGVKGSGHQQDAADHSPGFRRPTEQPKPQGLAPYKR